MKFKRILIVFGKEALLAFMLLCLLKLVDILIGTDITNLAIQSTAKVPLEICLFAATVALTIYFHTTMDAGLTDFLKFVGKYQDFQFVFLYSVAVNLVGIIMGSLIGETSPLFLIFSCLFVIIYSLIVFINTLRNVMVFHELRSTYQIEKEKAEKLNN